MSGPSKTFGAPAARGVEMAVKGSKNPGFFEQSGFSDGEWLGE